jgi:hypothetical protein
MGKSLVTPTRMITSAVVAGLGFFIWRGHLESVAFDRTALGDSETLLLSRFGPPDYREPAGKPYIRYTSVPCTSPCQTRLWWENELLPGIGAVSVELDTSGRVISKYRWVSP